MKRESHREGGIAHAASDGDAAGQLFHDKSLRYNVQHCGMSVARLEKTRMTKDVFRWSVFLSHTVPGIQTSCDARILA